ncbi:hypothetical protein ACFOSV_16170 [Algoriphagus namhaensis]|uniref:Uncharacterized protein n=1 Tax=Algoriphagus namhaensis TaxID=915353 RepID=A0ABV8AUQ3_9BACT
MSSKIAIFLISMLLLTGKTLAQNDNYLIEDSVIQVSAKDKVVWDLSFTFKTMNVFRGLLPSRAPAFSTLGGIKAGNFVLGFYGGASTNGGYTETDLILMYYRPRFNIRADWYYNFTEGITNIPTPSGFFDFNPEKTRGLLDFMAEVSLSKNFILKSSTFLFGRDRGVLPEDEEDGIELRRGDQRYSQYVKLSYLTKLNKAKLLVHAGYSYSWTNFSGPTFYADKAGFNDIGISITRNIIETSTVNIPFKASLTINPLTNNIYLVGTISVIELSKLN